MNGWDIVTVGLIVLIIGSLIGGLFLEKDAVKREANWGKE